MVDEVLLPFKRSYDYRCIEDSLSFVYQEVDKAARKILHLKYDACFKRKHNKLFQQMLKRRIKRLRKGEV